MVHKTNTMYYERFLMAFGSVCVYDFMKDKRCSRDPLRYNVWLVLFISWMNGYLRHKRNFYVFKGIFQNVNKLELTKLQRLEPEINNILSFLAVLRNRIILDGL